MTKMSASRLILTAANNHSRLILSSSPHHNLRLTQGHIRTVHSGKGPHHHHHGKKKHSSSQKRRASPLAAAASTASSAAKQKTLKPKFVPRSVKAKAMSSSPPTKPPPPPHHHPPRPGGKPGPMDPHLAAANRIAHNESSERLQASEALSLVDSKTKLRNVATAAGLLAFAGGVWWYSMHAVGRGETSTEDGDEAAAGGGAMKELEEAAAEARRVRDSQEREEEEMKGLWEGQDEEEDEEMMGKVKSDGGSGKRPLWKKVVFFWRRE